VNVQESVVSGPTQPVGPLIEKSGGVPAGEGVGTAAGASGFTAADVDADSPPRVGAARPPPPHRAVNKMMDGKTMPSIASRVIGPVIVFNSVAP
jgi:hypothetical protein